jgi:hypothetical protein
MSALSVVVDDDYGYAVVDRETGQVVALTDASDRAIAQAAAELAEHDKRVYELKRALAAEMRSRHGVGTVHAGGFDFKVAESRSWPVGATHDVLLALVTDGMISDGDYERCLPMKRVPHAVSIKALLGRLLVDNPDAHRLLAEACTVSPPSLRDVRAGSVDEAAA